MDDNLLYSIESFPPLPESIHKINELCSIENIDLKAVVEVIESDPLLYTDILRFSNVSYHGFRHPITSISHVIALFGISAVRGMALTAALRAHPFTDLSPYGLNIKEWFVVMEQQQRFLDIWLGKKHRHILQSLGGLTFILEIGRLVSSYALMFAKKEHQFNERDPKKLLDEEEAVVGASGDVLAADLFIFWNFDKLFIDCLKYSLSPEQGLYPHMCAALMSARTLFTLEGIRPFNEVEPLLEKFVFEVEDALISYEMLVAEYA